HLLARQHLLNGRGKVGACRLRLARGNAIAIINSTAIAQGKVAIKNDDGRHARNADRGREALADVLEHGYGSVAVVGVAGDAVEILVLVGINGEELDLVRTIFLLQRHQAGGVEVRDGTLGAEKSENEDLVVLEVVQSATVATRVPKRVAVG